MAPFRASALFWSIASQDRVNQVAVNWWLDSPYGICLPKPQSKPSVALPLNRAENEHLGFEKQCSCENGISADGFRLTYAQSPHGQLVRCVQFGHARLNRKRNDLLVCWFLCVLGHLWASWDSRTLRGTKSGGVEMVRGIGTLGVNCSQSGESNCSRQVWLGRFNSYLIGSSLLLFAFASGLLFVKATDP